jgi:hypothetical protein
VTKPIGGHIMNRTHFNITLKKVSIIDSHQLFLNVVAIVECIVNCLKHILNCHEQDFEDDYNAVIEYANIAYFRRVNFSKIPANITKPNEIVIAIPIELFYRKLKINSKYIA